MPARTVPDRLPGARLSSLLQRSIVLSATLAMVLFALPLAAVAGNLFRSRATSELARDAERARAVLTDVVLDRGLLDRVALPVPSDPDVALGIYDQSGRRVDGRGPAIAEPIVVVVARTGVESQVVVEGALVVAVPVTTDDQVNGDYVVRAAVPYDHVQAQVYLTWAAMLGLALVVLAVVAAVGRARATRIARPLESLAGAADALGHGDFSVRAVNAGVAEVDAVSSSLEATARRLGAMLERERSFTADASHQLRTPLTAVRLGLESALLTPGADMRGAAEEALLGLDRLEQTVHDLLTLARDTSHPRQATDVAGLVRGLQAGWSRTLGKYHRPLELRIEPDVPLAAVSEPALRTVLDVLLGNALTHGAGRVLVVVRATEATVVLEVADEGPGITGDPGRLFARRSPQAHGTGIGLALARSLVVADGGRLEVIRPVPAVFAVLLPVAAPDQRRRPGPDDDRPDDDVGGAGRPGGTGVGAGGRPQPVGTPATRSGMS